MIFTNFFIACVIFLNYFKILVSQKVKIKYFTTWCSIEFMKKGTLFHTKIKKDSVKEFFLKMI